MDRHDVMYKLLLIRRDLKNYANKIGNFALYREVDEIFDHLQADEMFIKGDDNAIHFTAIVDERIYDIEQFLKDVNPLLENAIRTMTIKYLRKQICK